MGAATGASQGKRRGERGEWGAESRERERRVKALKGREGEGEEERRAREESGRRSRLGFSLEEAIVWIFCFRHTVSWRRGRQCRFPLGYKNRKTSEVLI